MKNLIFSYYFKDYMALLKTHMALESSFNSTLELTINVRFPKTHKQRGHESVLIFGILGVGPARGQNITCLLVVVLGGNNGLV